MKKYILTSTEAQKTVDLRNHEDAIVDAIFDVIAEDDMVICTRNDCYFIDMDHPVTPEEESAIEAILFNSELGQYRTDDGKLITFITDDEPYPYTEKVAKLSAPED